MNRKISGILFTVCLWGTSWSVPKGVSSTDVEMQPVSGGLPAQETELGDLGDPFLNASPAEKFLGGLICRWLESAGALKVLNLTTNDLGLTGPDGAENHPLFFCLMPAQKKQPREQAYSPSSGEGKVLTLLPSS